MASDIDQSLSLKAQLKDEISPALRKMNASIKTTQEALKELGTSTEQLSQTIGSSTQNMADSNSRSAEKLQEDLKKTGGAFQDLSKEARTSSKEVGEALKEAFSLGGQGKTVSEMDNELEGLKRTLEGMASTSRPITSKSKNVKALGTDTLNRKVIPAFTALHDTLDDFPDTLGGINAAGKSGEGSVNKLSSALGAVNERVSGLGKTFDKLKFTLLDFASAVTTGFFGSQGMKLRGLQTSAGRKRGPGAFRQAETTVPLISMLSKAPEDVWGPAYETLLDTSSLALETFPLITDRMVELSKATGLSTAAFADMFVEMKEISNLSGEEWLDVTKKINFFVASSRATIEEIQQALAGSTEEMLGFSRAARKAYAEHSMAVAAQSATAGIGAGAGGDMFRTLQRDPTALGQAQGLLNSQGMDYHLRTGVMSGEMSDVFTNVADALAQFAQAEKAAGRNIQALEHRQAFEARFGSFASPEMALRLAERAQELGPGGFRDEAARLQKEGKDVNFQTLVGDVRGTAAEKIEQLQGLASAAGMQIGTHTIDALEKGMDPILAMTTNLVFKLNDLPEMAKQGIAFFSIGMNVMSALQNLPGVPDIIKKAISGPLEHFIGATVVANYIPRAMGGDSLTEQAADYFPGMPFLQEIAKERMQEREVAEGLSSPTGVYQFVPPPKTDVMDPVNWTSGFEKNKEEAKTALFEIKEKMSMDALGVSTMSPQERLELARNALKESQEHVIQLNALSKDKGLLKAKYWEENIKPDIQQKYDELSRKVIRDLPITQQNEIRWERAALEEQLAYTPAQIAGDSALADSLVKDEQIVNMRNDVLNSLRQIIAETDTAVDTVLAPIQRQQLAKSEELLKANQENNVLMVSLIDAVGNSGLTEAQKAALTNMLNSGPGGVPDPLGGSSGDNRVDREDGGRF